MPIDPSIALQSRPPSSEGMMNAMQTGMQMKVYKNKLAAAEAEQSRMGALRNYMRTHNMTTPEGRAGVNAFDPTGEAYKNLEAAYASSQSGGKTEDERAAANYNEVRNTVTGLLFMKDASGQRVPPTKEMVGQQLAMAKQRGLIRPEVADTMLATMPDDPNQIEVRLSRFLAEGLTPEQKNTMYNPKLEMADLGGTKQPYNPYTGAAVGSGMKVTISPDEQAQIDRQFDPNNVANITTNDQGDVRFWNKQGGEVKPGAGKGAGKPSAAVTTGRIKTEQLRKDLQSTVNELERIVKPGGLLDVSTGSGVGALVDRTAEFVGSSTEGAQAISRLKPISDMVLKLVPRFEGPQSDADTRSYRDAAGDLANPSLPREQRKAAAQTILRLFKQRQGQFGTPDADGSVVTGGAAPSTSGGSDIDALVNKHRTQ